jgi:hypothetical protein
VDKIIDITRRGDRIEFREQGAGGQRTTVIVGQTIRWQNTDAKPHQLVSDLEADGRPLFDTGPIGAGEHTDLLVDIDIYGKAGGKPANVISVAYHSTSDANSHGELQILSAARRGPSHPSRINIETRTTKEG